MPCRALEAFRLICDGWCRGNPGRLNALSGIGGVQTTFLARHGFPRNRWVLMPCRALEAFRPLLFDTPTLDGEYVLMPCRALEAFRHTV